MPAWSESDVPRVGKPGGTEALDRVAALPAEEEQESFPVRGEVPPVPAPEIVIELRKGPIDHGAVKALVDSLDGALSWKVVEELTALEEPLMNWLTQDPGRASKLFGDPFGTLADAGIKLSPEAETALRRLQQSQQGAAVADPWKHPKLVVRLVEDN